MTSASRVLVIAVVLVDKVNFATSIATELASSNDWAVDQRWAAIGNGATSAASLNIVWRSSESEPKFQVLNRLLKGVSTVDYDFVVVTDDDIELPKGFLDNYLSLVGVHSFALAQPARTHDSYIDHPFVEQLDGISARQTMFVEVGPLFSIRFDALPLIIPFDSASPMGWGYDFTWPVSLKSAGLRMGIIDCVPVRHNLREPVANYSYFEANLQMINYLKQRDHLEKEDAFRIVESFC